MEEPSPRSSRLVLAGALAATILVGGAGFLLGRATTTRPAPVVQPTASTPAPAPPVPTPTVPAGLGRAELMALAGSAADALAAGRGGGAGLTEAQGRRFELRLPFGCGGPAAEDSRAPMRWRYDPDAGVLRIHVEPAIWDAAEWFEGADANGIEAIEGFWIARPWTASEACPRGADRPAVPGAEPVTLPGQTLAIGQIFSADGARGGRRNGDPYTAAVRVAEGALDASRGFRLRVRGRLARIPEASPVHCRQPAGPDQRPICLVSVVLDEVTIENPASGEELATWTPAGSNTRGR